VSGCRNARGLARCGARCPTRQPAAPSRSTAAGRPKASAPPPPTWHGVSPRSATAATSASACSSCGPRASAPNCRRSAVSACARRRAVRLQADGSRHPQLQLSAALCSFLPLGPFPQPPTPRAPPSQRPRRGPPAHASAPAAAEHGRPQSGHRTATRSPCKALKDRRHAGRAGWRGRRASGEQPARWRRAAALTAVALSSRARTGGCSTAAPVAPGGGG
jgi:hypothetical protein